MTILQATSKVIDYLRSTKKTSIVLDDDFLDIVKISEEASDKAAVALALDEMEENQVFRKVELGDKKYYILTRDLESITQSVELSSPCAVEIASVIQSFCEVINDFKDECDPLNLTEKDIFNLTVICKFYLDAAASNQGGAKNE
tara:strand:+ start:80 stop:511 length:432 start_codon:yes stop_codon:yes gene_type:complete